MNAPAAPTPRYIKVSESGLLLPFEATDWRAVYIPAAEITVPRELVLPGTGNWQWAQDKCAALHLNGWTNWQAISRLEFCDHLVDDQLYGPCVDKAFFTIKDRYAIAWTRDEAAPRGYAVAVSLSHGVVYRTHRSNHSSALPCRPGQLS